MTDRLQMPQDFGVARGPYHELGAELAKQEARGDIEVFWSESRREGETHRAVPYVRLRSVEEVSRRSAERAVMLGGMASGTAVAVGFLVWEARWVLACLIGGGGALLLAAMLFLRLRRHAAGCFTKACAGCRHA